MTDAQLDQLLERLRAIEGLLREILREMTRYLYEERK